MITRITHSHVCVITPVLLFHPVACVFCNALTAQGFALLTQVRELGLFKVDEERLEQSELGRMFLSIS